MHIFGYNFHSFYVSATGNNFNSFPLIILSTKYDLVLVGFINNSTHQVYFLVPNLILDKFLLMY